MRFCSAAWQTGGHALRATLTAWFVCCAILAGTRLPADDERAALESKEEIALKQAAALVAPALVRIETVGGLDRVGQVLTATGPTTGLVVSPDGFVISSAFNFASRPASILVTLADGRRLAATQIATDKVKMLTLLKVDAENLPVPIAAPADSFRVGQWALALGKTLDETPSVSVGIVSALNRIWGKALQTDAKVSPVNYGGPLVDLEGRVLGVLVPLSPQASGEVAGAEWYDSGIGFAIPMVDVNATLDRLKGGKDLLPGLMGITIKGQDIYEGQPVIDRVRYGSPAHQAGLKDGDSIVELDGRIVKRQAQIHHVMGNKYAGESIAIKVKRGDEELSRDMTLIDKLVPYESAFLGILPARDGAGKGEPGVGVRYVIPESPAGRAGLDRGQRIVRFNGADVSSPLALLDLVSRLRPGEKSRLTVTEGPRKKEIELTLGALPPSVPRELRPWPIVPREKELADKDLKTGRFTDKMPAHDHEFWAYVPEDYNPEFKYGLVVWLHPGGDTMEAAMLKSWQTLCDERGLIFLAPKAGQIAGWIPDEIEFVKDCVDMFLEKYSIDRSRVVLHGYGSGGGFAYAVAFKHREQVKGVSTVAAPMVSPPPDNEPDFRLQFHLTSGENDPQHRGVEGTVKGLRELKYPVVQMIIEGAGHKYPVGDYLTEIAVWIDALDRI
jgi:serine protease Do